SSADVIGQTISPLRTVTDVNIGQTQTVKLTDGTSVTLSVLSAEETRDEFRDAVRSSRIRVSVNGKEVTLDSGNYNLPVSAGSVMIDCPITKAYYTNSQSDSWGLESDVRLRLWPAGSPFINPGTFVYPAGQRWFASDTQMSNEPVFVDAGEEPSSKKIYYHNGLDIGGPEGMVDVFSATDGLVVSKGVQALEGQEKDTPVAPRYDVIYILDDRGWYYRYSHLKSFETNVIPGERVKMGQKIGELGKEGGSGGWSHLHFEIICRQPSGKWGTEEGYVYLWEAYAAQYKPSLIAVARPHQLVATGRKVLLKGDKSRCFDGSIVSYEWLLSDGTKATGPVIEHVYRQPGIYSEVLKVTDSRGNVDYDFTVVNVIDKNRPDSLPPTIHVTYSPSFDIQPGDPVTFKVRSFRTGPGRETWDFGDGSPGDTTASNPPGDQHDPQGYAVIVHRFKKAGLYLVRVERAGENGFKAVGHVDVMVGKGTGK
ncbi:peptidoglycan DD-metalloendopeptidase family protein, partial [bacterium]|nr:peptidoglycan DD-metalloendopeptidase family protein [bacterium]